MKNRIQNPHPLQLLVLTLCALFGVVAGASAQSNGVWTNTVSDNWSDPVAWSNAVIANGSGSIADLSQVAIPSNTTITVTLDLGVTNEDLYFGNTTNQPGFWVLADGGTPWTIDSLTTPNSIINVSLLNGAANNLITGWSTATITANIQGTNTLVKSGPSQLILNPNLSGPLAGNAYTGGTVISNGLVELGVNTGGSVTLVQNTATLGTGPVTFMGGGLRLMDAAVPGQNPSTTPTELGFTNAIIVPAGQSGTLYMSPRAFPSVSSPVSGGGTINWAVDYVRDDLAADFSGFSGTVNFMSSTRQASDLRIAAAFNDLGLANARVAIVSNGINANTVNLYNNGGSGSNVVIGELSAVTPGIISVFANNTTAGAGNSLPFVLTVGGLNTTARFSGNFSAPGAANGVGIVKVGSGTWILDGPTIENNGITVVSNGVLQLGNGGTSGKLGRTTVVSNFAAIAFNRSDTVVATNVIDGPGTVSQIGAGTLILAPASGSSTYTGKTIASSGLIAPATEAALGATPGSPVIDQLTLNGGGLRSTGNLAIASANRGITLGTAGGTLAPDAATTLTLSSPVAGAGNLTINGAGTTVLAGPNSYTGKTLLTGGTLQLSSLSALGATPAVATADQLTLNGGSLTSSGSLAINDANRGITVAAASTVAPGSGTTLTLAEPIVGTGALVVNGAGTVNINGADTRTGVTRVSQGTLAIGASGSISASPVISVGGGAIFDATAAGFILGNGQTLTGNGTVSGAFIAGNGSALNAGTNGAAGVLSFANNVTLSGATDGVDISVATNDLLNISGGLTLNGANTLQVNLLSFVPAGEYPLIKAGSVNGPGSLSLAGYPVSRLTATLVTNAPNHSIDLLITGSVGTLVWSGTANVKVWDINTTPNWLNGAVADVYLDGDNVSFTDVGAANPGVTLAQALSPSSVSVNSGTDYTFSGKGKLTGLTSIMKSGADNLIVLTTNDFGGGTTISSGGVQVGNGTASGSLGTGPIVDNGSLTYNLPNSQTVASSISGSGSLTVQAGTVVLTGNNSYGASSIAGGATLQVGSGGNLGVGGVSDNGALVYNRTGVVTNTGSIGGSGSLTVNGAGDTVVLAANNSYGGPTLVNAGVLQVGAGGTSGTLGAAGSVTLTNGGGLAFSRSDILTNNIAINGTNGVLVQVGPGTLVITNDFNSIGSTLINGGKLQVGDGVDASGTLNGPITITAPGQLVYNRPDPITISNAIGGTGSLAAIGPTNLTVTTVSSTTGNSYSGGTTISNSSLVLLAAVSNPAQVGVATANQSGLGSGPITFLGNSSLQWMWGNVQDPDANGAGTITTPIVVPAGQTGTIWAPGRYTWTSDISGGGTLKLGVNYVRGDVNATWTNFTGELDVITNALYVQTTFDFRMNTASGIPNGKVNIADFVSMYSRAAANSLIPIGELSGGANATIRSTSGGGTSPGVNVNWEVGGLNTSATYFGSLLDGNSFTKIGTGTWTLAGANTFTGNLVVSNGIVQLSGDGATTGVLLDAAVIATAGPGVIDPSGLPDDTLHVGDGAVGQIVSQTLGGTGTVKDGAYIGVSGTVAPGFSTNVFGNLTVTSNLLVDGALSFKVDHVTTAVNDSVSASNIIISPSGQDATLTVTQVNTNYLQTGDVFRLFNHPVSKVNDYAAVNLPATSPDGVINYVWSDKTAVDGTIVLVSGGTPMSSVNAQPTNLVFGVSSGVLNLSWPADHTGWRLQVQTNPITTGLQPGSNSWTDVPGSTATNQESFPISTENGTVFFRLIYP